MTGWKTLEAFEIVCFIVNSRGPGLRHRAYALDQKMRVVSRFFRTFSLNDPQLRWILGWPPPSVFARELIQLRAAGYSQVGDYLIPPAVQP